MSFIGDGPDDHLPASRGLEAELADVVIRIMDYAAAKGLRVAEAINDDNDQANRQRRGSADVRV